MVILGSLMRVIMFIWKSDILINTAVQDTLRAAAIVWLCRHPLQREPDGSCSFNAVQMQKELSSIPILGSCILKQVLACPYMGMWKESEEQMWETACSFNVLCNQGLILMPHSCSFYILETLKYPNETGFGKATSSSYMFSTACSGNCLIVLTKTWKNMTSDPTSVACNVSVEQVLFLSAFSKCLNPWCSWL